jgi:MFS family permease
MALTDVTSEPPLQTRNFSLVMLQTVVSTFSTSIFTVLILWITLKITGSAFLTGVISSALVIPLAFNFLVGAAIDNVQNKKLLAIAGSVIRSISALCLLAALLLPSEPYGIAFLLISAVTFGFTMDIFAPVRLIWSKKYLTRPVYLKGMSVMTLASRGSKLLGYLFAAFLISASLMISSALVAALYTVSAIPIFALTRANDRFDLKPRILKSIREGITYIRSSGTISACILIFVLGTLFSGMSDTTFTVEIGQTLHLGASSFSLIFMAISLGGIAGSAMTAKIKEGTTLWLAGSYSIAAVSMLLLSLFATGYTILILPFFLGLGTGVSSPIITSLILGSAESSKVGRIQGVMDTFGFSFNSVSGVLAGSVILLSSPSLVFLIIGSGLLATTLLVLMLFRNSRLTGGTP